MAEAWAYILANGTGLAALSSIVFSALAYLQSRINSGGIKKVGDKVVEVKISIDGRIEQLLKEKDRASQLSDNVKLLEGKEIGRVDEVARQKDETEAIKPV